jgi:glycosyltransferase involved in cell wall biosynthesis
MPKISIVMAVHNGAPYLVQALDSIAAQTTQDWELVVVDDASTDTTPTLLGQWGHPNLKQVRNETNLGLTKSLNVGISHATGAFIARMDADDVCMPTRFEAQLTLFEHMPSLALVGGDLRLIDGSDTYLGTKRFPHSTAAVQFAHRISSAISHPAALMRRDALEAVGGYNEDIRIGQDYDLWERLFAAGYQASNVAEQVLSYRLHGGALTHKKRDAQLAVHVDVMRRSFRRWAGNDDLDPAEMDAAIRVLAPDQPRAPSDTVRKALALLSRFSDRDRARGGADWDAEAEAWLTYTIAKNVMMRHRALGHIPSLIARTIRRPAALGLTYHLLYERMDHAKRNRAVA